METKPAVLKPISVLLVGYRNTGKTTYKNYLTKSGYERYKPETIGERDTPSSAPRSTPRSPTLVNYRCIKKIALSQVARYINPETLRRAKIVLHWDDDLEIQVEVIDSSGMDIGYDSIPASAIRDSEGVLIFVSMCPRDMTASSESSGWCHNFVKGLEKNWPVGIGIGDLKSADPKDIACKAHEKLCLLKLVGSKSDLFYTDSEFKAFCETLIAKDSKNRAIRLDSAALTYWRAEDNVGMALHRERVMKLHRKVEKRNSNSKIMAATQIIDKNHGGGVGTDGGLDEGWVDLKELSKELTMLSGIKGDNALIALLSLVGKIVEERADRAIAVVSPSGSERPRANSGNSNRGNTRSGRIPDQTQNVRHSPKLGSIFYKDSEPLLPQADAEGRFRGFSAVRLESGPCMNGEYDDDDDDDDDEKRSDCC